MITDGQKDMAIKSKVINLTKYIMSKGYNEEDAYKKLIRTHLYELLLDKNTDLYLEPIEYMIEAYNIEIQKSVEAMVEFILLE